MLIVLLKEGQQLETAVQRFGKGSLEPVPVSLAPSTFVNCVGDTLLYKVRVNSCVVRAKIARKNSLFDTTSFFLYWPEFIKSMLACRSNI